jgi:hypothetical protein
LHGVSEIAPKKIVEPVSARQALAEEAPLLDHDAYRLIDGQQQLTSSLARKQMIDSRNAWKPSIGLLPPRLEHDSVRNET